MIPAAAIDRAHSKFPRRHGIFSVAIPLQFAFKCPLVSRLRLLSACSLHDAMHQDQGEPKRDNTDGNTHQYEERPSDLERSPLPPALTLFRAACTVD